MKFQPGQSGNPGGRPKKAWTMAGLIEQALEETEDTTGLAYKYLVVQKLRRLAMDGDLSAIKELNDRIDGKPMQQTDVTSGGDKIETPMIILDTQEPKHED